MATKKGLGSFIKGLFGIADDVPTTTVDPDKIKKIDDFTSGYDKSTKPGEFKKGPKVIDEEGNTVVQEVSYNPESFTDMQRRTGVGEFSDEALGKTFMDSVDADVMSLDEYIIKRRGITIEQLEAERLSRSKPVGETTTTGSRPTIDDFIKRVQLNSPLIRSEEQIREAIINVANRGYEPGSPKRLMFDDDASINAYLDNQLMYNEADMEEFIIEFYDELRGLGSSENKVVDGILYKSLEGEQKAIYEAAEKTNKEIVERAEDSLASLKMLEDMGVDTSSINKDPFKFPPTTDDKVGFQELAEEMEKLGELFQKEIGSARGVAPENMGKSMDAINAQVAADESLAESLMNEVIEKAEMGQYGSRKEAQKALTEIKEKFNKVPQAKKDAIKSGVYVSPFETKRTLNAKGGRIGFAEGDFVAPEDIMTRPADNETRMAEYMAKVQSGELVYDPETKEFIPAPKKRRRQNTRPADNEQFMSELMRRMKMNEMYGKKDGGRIGFSEGGGGPKMGRRGFLGLMGAGLASLMVPFGRGVKEVAPVVTKAIQPVAGMPDWFPLLVNRIRTKGKVTREPGYKELTSGGDAEKVYELDGYTVYEDMTNGRITVTGRGNDYQQVSMEYIPGENKVMSKKNPLTGKMERGVVTDKPKFEAGEYAKGDPYDYENFGDYDDMKGDLSNWENFATGGKKIDQKKSVIDDFIKSQTDPNVIDDMAKGGRVGMAQGGIASKFKERINYGY